jgi:hypothetical protein
MLANPVSNRSDAYLRYLHSRHPMNQRAQEIQQEVDPEWYYEERSDEIDWRHPLDLERPLFLPFRLHGGCKLSSSKLE